MTTDDWLSLAILVAAIALFTPLLGGYMAKVFGGGSAPGDRVFAPVERLVYRACGIDPDREQRWTVYATSLLAFSVVSVLALFLLQRAQHWLPLNPTDRPSVPSGLAFNTAVSFVTNTNWQNYAGEATMSHLTQMMGLATQNFVSAAVGIAVAIALVRGITRRRAATIGNFWVDLTRATIRVLLPLAFVAALVLVSQGVVQNLSGNTAVTTVQGVTQQIPGGPVASQEAIKEIGTNGGGFFNANASHPFENPNGFTNLFEIFLLLLIPFSLTSTFGKLAKDARQGWVIFAAMFSLWIAASGVVMGFEIAGNPRLNDAGVTQQVTAFQGGGNAEGKEVRFGPATSGLYAASTTGTSTGSVNSMHDSFTPAGGGTVLLNIMLGEVSPGGVGAGLYGILVFALLAVFLAGLMVGRTPEFLGKRVQAAEMKLVVLYLLAVPLVLLGFTAASVAVDHVRASALNAGPHGLTEITYAFASASTNNGSAFAGLSGDTDWYNTTLAVSMLVGRFLLIVPVLAIAGSLARKQPSPATTGTFPTSTPLFAVLLVGVIVLVVGLTFFPVLALGPVAEQLGL
jgi:K+-transporting ATPase ATPase A chain